MNLIGGIVGGMMGLFLLGPLGALIGSVLGSRMSNSSVTRKNPNNFDHQLAFFAALFACLAKIAKADGQVTTDEINKIEDFISKKFNLNGEERNFAINIFQKAKDDNVSFDSYASQLAKLLKQSPNSLVIFYELLFELALADGVLHPNEEKLLKRVPKIFGFGDQLYDQLFQKYGLKTSNHYQVLGVSKEMTFNEIRKVYLKKRREFHPDKLISKGLPEELIEKAKEKFIEIQEAYEELEKIHKK